MIKRIARIVCVVLVLLIVCTSCGSASTYDSIHLKNSEQKEMQKLPFSTVIRFYSYPMLYSSISRDDPIADMEEYKSYCRVGIFLEFSSLLSCTKWHDETGALQTYYKEQETAYMWDELCKYALHPQLVFGPFTQVSGVYCIDNAVPFYAHIYYRTNKGDYVLYQGADDKTYLIPWEEYRVMADTVAEEAGKQFVCGALLPEHYYDLSEYEFNGVSPLICTLVFYFVIGVAAVCCVTFGIVLIVKRKKKRKSF